MQARLLELELGRAAIVRFDDSDLPHALAQLLPDEQTAALALGQRRQIEHAFGRVAMRTLVPDAPSIGATDRGGPQLPAGLSGSISHKPNVAVAVVAPSQAGHVGIDLEVAAGRRIDIAPRILTPRERDMLPDPTRERERGRAVMLRFAIKEAIYKAIDPIVRRYVGFTEVELDVLEDGRALVTAVDPLRLTMPIEAHWRELDGYWLATARALRT